MADLTSGTTANNNLVWHSGNDGPGSGLDADQINGTSYDQFVRKDGFTENVSAGDLSVGWYTIATNTGNRAFARFGIRDTNGGRHQSIVFYAQHHYGRGNGITILHTGRFSTRVIRYLRILEGGTYDGAMLQAYVENGTNSLVAFILGDNFHSSGWDIADWVPDGTDPGGGVDFPSLTTGRAQVDLQYDVRGSIITSGSVRVNGTINKGSGSFDIPHPDPNKSEWRLRHGFVESPTRGDNIYRFDVLSKKHNDHVKIDLPSYYQYLNEDSQIQICAKDNFFAGYGYVKDNKIHCYFEGPGNFNVLCIATRKDTIAKNYWDTLGVEYKGKSNG